MKGRLIVIFKSTLLAVILLFGVLSVAGAQSNGGGASGLYVAPVRRSVFRATGGTEWALFMEYYLLDPDGKLYHGWLPEAPGGGFLRFDYDEARLPGNSGIGSYTVSGNRVSLNEAHERTTGTLLGPDELEIRGTKYKRSVK